MGASEFTIERRVAAARAIAELPVEEFKEVCSHLDYEGLRIVARIILVTASRKELEDALLRLSHEERLDLLRAWRRSS